MSVSLEQPDHGDPQREELPAQVYDLLEQVQHLVEDGCAEHGWTLDRLAMELGVEPERLRESLSDPRHLTLSRLARIAEVLRMRFAIEERL